MFLPESMSRIVIVGNKSRLDEAINALYKLDAVHLIDHTVGADEGFSIGAPRPYSSKASERLLALRAAEKDLGINPAAEEIEPISVEDIDAQISSNGVENVQSEVMAAIDEKNKIAQKIAEMRVQEASLQKLSKLSVNLEYYSGYENLAVFVGSVKADPSQALAALENAEYEVSFDKKEGGVAAVFIKKADKDKASSILSDYGYSEIVVPDIAGSPADALSYVQNEIAEAESQLAENEAKIAGLSEKYKSFIVASDEELSMTVKKGETPLRIAMSDFSFVIDGWVPTADVEDVQKGLNDMLGDSIYVEVQEERGRSEEEFEEAEPRFRKTPTKWKNGAYGKHFEFPVSLLSVPKYNEIDPSTIIGIFFPFFFGFMVGDLGYAIPFIVLGAYGLRHAKSQEFRAIGTVLFFGGIWAAIFGFFFFGEMLGMHFIGHSDGVSVTWESLLGIQLPDWFANIFIDAHGVSKLHEATFLLKVSVYMGIVHLLLAYIVKFANIKMRDGFKEAYLEAGGWIFSFVGMVIFCYGLTEIMFGEGGFSNIPENALLFLGVGGVILIIGIISCFPKDGAQAVLELPGIVGNILSYTRLTAIGMSKAGMALAFNYIAIIMLGGTGSVGGVIAGALVFIIGHLMIWVLAILSAGLHGLRLQYVEMMNKFFIGGGEEYSPLSIKRKHTKHVEIEV